ncbi:hypothetical protein KKF81_05220 [Candidatus Micrarchaeota archaeon]|nr:hypothetical protein [Candidatus Micrarchaeota archaeon]MBU1166327.1 hypothetical protein [Candidatus Micrarchaeota archaeon]MBU1886421.1 hypothetical protein [Candidatus Micrarchaeota archaeon]
MKTITIGDEVYKKLLDAKHTLGVRSFTEVLRKILSEDRVKWVYHLSGKIHIDESKIKSLKGDWKKWSTE